MAENDKSASKESSNWIDSNFQKNSAFDIQAAIMILMTTMLRQMYARLLHLLVFSSAGYTQSQVSIFWIDINGLILNSELFGSQGTLWL